MSGRLQVDGWVWPPAIPAPARFEEARAGGLRVRHPAPDVELARALVGSLHRASRGLTAIPVAQLAEILSRAGARVVRGLDGAALDEAAANASMSRAMVAEVIEGVSASWTGDALTRLVAAEFPEPRVLDGFAAGPERALRAAGPAVTLHLGAGTVPGVTVTSIIRALLVKSAVLVKPGAGDVALTARFAREVARVDPRLAAAVAVQYWPGGAASWRHWERELLHAADQVVVYGGDDTIESVRSRAPASTRLIEHPHRLGVAVIDPRGAPQATADAARAVALFDQRGCVSTHLILLVGARSSAARRWCADLAARMAAVETALPPGRATAGELSALHQLRGRLSMRIAAAGGAGRGTLGVWHREGSRWTVILAPPGAFEAVGQRTAWVVPVPDPPSCVKVLAPLASALQTVGLAGLGGDREPLAGELAALGVTRIAPLGEVPFPKADWLHDGSRPLGELVRWTELR